MKLVPLTCSCFLLPCSQPFRHTSQVCSLLSSEIKAVFSCSCRAVDCRWCHQPCDGNSQNVSHSYICPCLPSQEIDIGDITLLVKRTIHDDQVVWSCQCSQPGCPQYFEKLSSLKIHVKNHADTWCAANDQEVLFAFCSHFYHSLFSCCCHLPECARSVEKAVGLLLQKQSCTKGATVICPSVS